MKKNQFLLTVCICVQFFYISFLEAQTKPDELTNLDEMVVSASRYAQSPFETAASIDLINREQIQDGQAMIHISESLGRVPGVFAMNRQNYAQDVMISIRGFGANSPFGARGIRVLVDGIPATMPDGQSQLSHVDLGSTQSIEVLRGPFSVLYGNSAGGVINFFTEKGKPGTEITPYGSYGSFNTSKVGSKVTGANDHVNYVLDASAMRTDGSRTHSQASRDNESAKLIFGSGDTKITLIGNRISLSAEDPLGLTVAQLASSPQGAGNNAEKWNTRKTVTQLQGGVELVQKIDSDNGLKLMVFSGTRNQSQFQASTSTTVVSNGALSLDRQFEGFDGQYQYRSQLQGMPVKITTGISYGNDRDRSKGYCNLFGILTNCSGKTTNISADANYVATNFDQYVQLQVDPTDSMNMTAGVRHTDTEISGNDNIGTSFSPTSKAYRRFMPMASTSYLLNAFNRLYISGGLGYDTPTLNQIKYSCATNCSTTTNTLNLLEAANTRQFELGYKTIFPSLGYANVALFTAQSEHEIVALANVSGKTVYQNANATKRQGIEFLGHFDMPYQLASNLSYTYTKAIVSEDYATQSNGTIVSGTKIPGVPQHKFFGEVFWKPRAESINIGAELIGISNMYAADTNVSNSNSSGYVVTNLRMIAKQKWQNWTFTEFARVNNLTDVYYVGSVIINQTSSQYFEPAPGRNWVIGVQGSFKL